jgi:hypothetical protein
MVIVVALYPLVMAGLDPAIHVFLAERMEISLIAESTRSVSLK